MDQSPRPEKALQVPIADLRLPQLPERTPKAFCTPDSSFRVEYSTRLTDRKTFPFAVTNHRILSAFCAVEGRGKLTETVPSSGPSKRVSSLQLEADAQDASGGGQMSCNPSPLIVSNSN